MVESEASGSEESRMNVEYQPCRVWWDDEDGVARAEWQPGADCGLEVARDIDGRVGAMGHGKVPLLVDIRNIGSIDRPAREYFMDSATHYTGVALLAQSAATRMMANFFLGLNRGENRVRMFTVEADALGWLHGQG
jgi:hypothetical protein